MNEDAKGWLADEFKMALMIVTRVMHAEEWGQHTNSLLA